MKGAGGMWGPSSKGSTRATQKSIIIKKGTAWGPGLGNGNGVSRGGTTFDVSGAWGVAVTRGCGPSLPLRLSKFSFWPGQSASRGIPRLGAPISSFHGTVTHLLHMRLVRLDRCPYDFCDLTLLPSSSSQA